MKKYNKYIEYVNNAFKNSFERAGGENYRFYHSLNVANTALQENMKRKIILKDMKISVQEWFTIS